MSEKAGSKSTRPTEHGVACEGCGEPFESEFMDAWCRKCLAGWHAECMVAQHCGQPTAVQRWVSE